MGRHRDDASAGSSESGAVLVLFAVFMSVAILLMAFTLDVGNWFEHKRHLQTQADAAAFAAAGRFAFPCTATIEKGIYETAGQYGGVSSVITPGATELSATPLYNAQVGKSPGTQGTVREEVNKKTYFGQAKPDNTVEKAPCDPEASMIDVKMTETSLPGLFSVVGKIFNVPYINAHARVSIVKQQFATAVEPAIESEPKEARVFFVNDNPDGSTNYNNELLATGLLTNIGSNEEKGTIKWSDASAPVAVNITKPHIGVRIALAGKLGALKGVKEGGVAANEAVGVCQHEYVECFDEDSGVIPPLLNISGYSLESKGKSEPLAPVTHKVTLSTPAGNTCTDAYFSNFPGTKQTPNCTLTITAELDYGNASLTGMTVTPEVVYTRGFTGEKPKIAEAELTKPAKSGEPWVGVVQVPSVYYDNDGSSEINLVVKCKKEAKAPCEKSAKSEETSTIKDVQRTYNAGPDGSNRIVDAKVFEPGGAKPVPGEKDADAFRICEPAEPKCEHKLAVTIELKGSLEDATKYLNKEGKPIPPFHIVSGDNDQESDDQFVVSCPPTTSSAGIEALYDEALQFGCKGKYSANSHGGSCTLEKTAQEQIEKEEKAEKEAGEKEATAKKTRETKEATERTTWTAEEKEAKITKAQRETREKEKETKALWERQEGKGEITKAQREAKEKTKGQLEKEEKEGKITKAQRETKEKEAETKALWERQEGKGEITKAQRETKEVTKAQLEKEEKEFKVTKAQREAKEKEQTTVREAAEKAEATAKEKRAKEEQATKEAKEKQAGAAHECVGLVSTQGVFPSEAADTANFQHYFAKRIEGAPNGTKFSCPNKWINNNEGGIPIIPSNDSRLIQFFVVPFTVTDFERKNEVSPLVPIENFASFYVTGWGWNNYEAAQGNKEWNPKERRDECSEKLFKKLPAGEKAELEDETKPLKEREEKEKAKGFDDDTEQPREIVGHLIKYVNVLDEAPGTVPCELSGPETCEAALTE